MENKEKTNYSQTEILSVLRFGLQNFDSIVKGEKKIEVKDIYISNVNTLICEYYSKYEKAYDIKVEMASIMGLFSGFFKDDLFEGLEFAYFGIKAFNNFNEELLYSISNRKIANIGDSGNSIHWLSNTLFRENTPEFRLIRAKILISDIENAIRKVIIDIYTNKYGNNWWEKSIDTKIQESVKSTYFNQFTESINDGSILLNYSYTLDLKKIICASWGDFKHLFTKMDDFGKTMDRLNLIRREEAHNREISRKNIEDLEGIYEILLDKISMVYPSINLQFMIDYWRQKIKSILIYEKILEPTYSMELFKKSNKIEQLDLLVEDTNKKVIYFNNLLDSLKTIKVPLSKKEKHNTIQNIFIRYIELQEQRKDCIFNKNINELSEINHLINQHIEFMNKFSIEFELIES